MSAVVIRRCSRRDRSLRSLLAPSSHRQSLRRGRSGSGMPSAIDPGKPSRPTPGAASVVAVHRGDRVVAAPGACPLPHGRVDGGRDANFQPEGMIKWSRHVPVDGQTSRDSARTGKIGR